MSKWTNPAAIAALCLAAGCAGAQATAATRHEVEIRGFTYEPARLTVSPGDTVVWLNRDAVPHTATSEGGGWDSGSIPAGGSWEWVVTENASGEYLCTFHPSMMGEIVVGTAAGR